MTNDIRVIGLDLDETALNSDKQLTPCVAAAIQKAIEAGVVVLPATGRQLDGIPKSFLEIPGVRYALVSNGASVYDLKTGEIIYSACFEKEVALSVLGQIHGYDTLTAIYMDGRGFTQGEDMSRLEPFLSPATMAYLRSSRIVVPSLEALIQASRTGVEKFSLNFTDPAERLRAHEELQARGDVEVTSSIATNAEVNAKHTHKGTALVSLAKHLGFTREQVMAIGDSTNDLMMLKTVGHGVAMCNGHPEVRAIADEITEYTCNEDGVAAAIEKVLAHSVAADLTKMV